MTDSFDRADSSTSLGSGWTAHNGTWGIESNKAYLVSATPGSVASIEAGVADGDVAFDVTMQSGSSVGVVFRLVDSGNYLLVPWFSSSLMVYKSDNGDLTELAIVGRSWTAGTTYRLRVNANGDQVKVYIDDIERLTYTLSAGDQSKYGAATSHGMWSNGDTNARFDEFAVMPA